MEKTNATKMNMEEKKKLEKLAIEGRGNGKAILKEIKNAKAGSR